MLLLKHILALLLFSVLFVLSMPYMHQAAQWLVQTHEIIGNHLKDLFQGGQAGMMAKQLIALLALPLLVGLIPALIFWILRRQWMSSFIHIVWAVWLLQVGVLAAMSAATKITN